MDDRGTRVATSFLICLIAIPVQLNAWELRLPSSDGYGGISGDVRFDQAGDVVTVGTLNDHMVAAKVTRAGRSVWLEEVVLGQGRALAFAGDGSIALVGAGDAFFYSPTNASNDVAAAFLTPDGAQTFLHAPPLDGNHTASDVVVDSNGDIIASGASGNYEQFASGYFSVLKITGSNPWETTISPNPVNGHSPIGAAVALALTPDGNVVATGRTYTMEPAIGLDGEPSAGTVRSNLVVAKLDSDDGTILWQVVIDDPSSGYSIAVDGAGDVVVGGTYGDNVPGKFSGDDFAVFKFAGSDGQEVWRAIIDGDRNTEAAHSVAIDSGGNVIAGGRLGLDNDAPFVFLLGPVAEHSVVKLSGVDGQEIWRSQYPNDVTVPQSPTALGVVGAVNAVAVDGADNVVVTGYVAGDLFAAKLDGGAGGFQWTRSFGPGAGYAVDVSADGSSVIAGKTEPENGDQELFVAGLSVSLPVDGRLLRMRDKGVAAKRQLKFIGQAALIDKLQPGSLEDPTLHGANISILDRGSGQQLSIALPADHWESTSSGYRYKDTQGASGPCSVVKISKRKIFAKCSGAEVDLLSGNAPLGSVHVRLAFGGEQGFAYCSEFGGQIKKNDAARYLAKGAAKPADCQL